MPSRHRRAAAPLFAVAALLGALAASPADAAPTRARGQASADPCREYSEWLCKEAKDTEVVCVAMRHLVEILPPEACRQALAQKKHSADVLDEWRQRCDALLDRLCTDLGPTTATCKSILDQRAYFTPDRCADMWDDYDRMIGQFRREEAKLHPLPEDVAAQIAQGDAPSFGPANAPVTLVMFVDFECPFCVKARFTAGAVFQKYGTRVRFVLRQLPLNIHPHAELAARAALEAHAQGKFWPFHDALFAHPDELDRDGLVRRADEVGLDVARFTAALDSGRHAEALREDTRLAELANVDGTPTLFVGTRRIEHPGDYREVLAEVERQLAEAAAREPGPALHPLPEAAAPVSGVPAPSGG